MTDEMRSSPAQLAHAQQEALKVFAATAKRGCVEFSSVEGELSKLGAAVERCLGARPRATQSLAH
jgi:hypothetical protein